MDWKFVPAEATDAMVNAVRENDVDLVRDGFDGGMRKLYRAMLAAAPSSEEVQAMLREHGEFIAGDRIPIPRSVESARLMSGLASHYLEPKNPKN